MPDIQYFATSEFTNARVCGPFDSEQVANREVNRLNLECIENGIVHEGALMRYKLERFEKPTEEEQQAELAERFAVAEE
jgi:hypothetical protein